VGHAAKIIAGKYFPEAERPLDEAALGPLLTQSQIWIKSLCKTEKNTSGEKISQNTDTITLSHEILHRYLAAQTGANLRKNLGYVSLDEMAFNDLSRVKKSSPVGIAIDVGWMVSKKAFINFICRYSFDMACQELEMIYSQSRTKEAKHNQESNLNG